MATITHGALVRGCSGADYYLCERRSTADRIRRITRAWAAGGGWTGARTMEWVADVAAQRPGRRTSAILAELREIQRSWHHDTE